MLNSVFFLDSLDVKIFPKNKNKNEKMKSWEGFPLNKKSSQCLAFHFFICALLGIFKKKTKMPNKAQMKK